VDRVRLLKLGILLLEIFCGQKMEDRRQEENQSDGGKLDDIADLGLLQRWVQAKESEGALSWASKEAISYCMACFGDPRANLQDADFRESIIEKVLKPLRGELYHWKGDI
jgi:hypothetical protein